VRGYAIAEPGLKTRFTCSRGIATGAEITTSDTTTATTSGSTAAEPKRLSLWVHIIPQDGATSAKQTLARLLGRQTKVDHLVRPALPPLGRPMTCSVDDPTASPAWWMDGSKRILTPALESRLAMVATGELALSHAPGPSRGAGEFSESGFSRRPRSTVIVRYGQAQRSDRSASPPVPNPILMVVAPPRRDRRMRFRPQVTSRTGKRHV
jgi:hypothetical protein